MKYIGLLLACSIYGHITAQSLFTLIPSNASGIKFQNVISETKEVNILNYEYLYNGGGVAIGDINNDGLSDIYFSGNMVPNKLFLNKGNLQFQDITTSSGTSAEKGFNTGVSMVDINQDGYLDIYVCRSASKTPESRKNLLFINNKNNTFTESAKKYGIDDASFSTQAYFFDMDLDKDLDLVLINHPSDIGSANDIHVGYNKQGVLAAKENTEREFVSYRYYENNNGKFIDKTIKAGLGTHAFGLSAIIADFNKDGYPDIYACNDYVQPDYLFINNKNGTFTERAKEYFQHFSMSSMGSDYADINNDGLPDLMTVDMLAPELNRIKRLKGPDPYDIFYSRVKYGFGHQYVKNVLQLNNGNGSYSDISYLAGVALTDWSWAPLIADFDNDGNKDIYITNGFLRDLTDMDYAKFKSDSLRKAITKMSSDNDAVKALGDIPTIKRANFFFRNNGNLTFSNLSNGAGMQQPLWSNGAAYADLDNDGDLEIIVNNIFDDASIYKNNSVENKLGNYVRFTFTTNTSKALGANIALSTTDGSKQFLHFMPTKGFLSNHEQALHFGIGKNATAKATITWLDGRVEVIDNVIANTSIVCNYENAKVAPPVTPVNRKLFKDITKSTKLNYTPVESDYIDFKQEPLLPHTFSRLGPALAVGDMDGNGTDDFFVGGSLGQAAKLFLQNTSGSFSLKNSSVIDADKAFEDVNALCVDIDLDKDLDLIVISGGNEILGSLDKYPVRLYINDGKGNFSKSDAISNINTSAKALAVSDYDKDGDLDLFVGGYIIPGHYGLFPNSYLLQNNNGKFTDITMQYPSLQKIGMLTDAKWADINKDGFDDLIVVGEWMAPTIFMNEEGKLNSAPKTIPNASGWWNTLEVRDADNDGDIDLLAGNLGVNSRYRCDASHPLMMHVSDFDNNGSTDCVISIYQDGSLDKARPIAFRDNMLDQMVFLKKKFLRYQTYATASVDEMFTKEQLQKAQKLEANMMQSSIFTNDGSGNFTRKSMPARAQFSPIQAIASIDLDKDNLPEIIAVGNNYETDVETGRDDAGIGVVLKYNKTSFSALDNSITDFNAAGNVKNMKLINVNGKTCFLIGKANEPLQLIQYNP